jgi:hypothetical protein
MNEIVNRVSQSGLVTIDLEDFFPKEEHAVFDLKDFLFMGLILKEKDFREALKNHNWEQYQNKHVSITCSADAIIPAWAYMLITTYLQPIAAGIFVGTGEEMQKQLLLDRIRNLNQADYNDQRIVIKGCGDLNIEPFAYAAITNKLLPVAKSIMYGEPCSTVPVYKKK